jgi:hypothetical protein
MGDEQLSVNEPDICLDALEPVVEGVEKRTSVLIIVVGVGPLQP